MIINLFETRSGSDSEIHSWVAPPGAATLALYFYLELCWLHSLHPFIGKIWVFLCFMRFKFTNYSYSYCFSGHVLIFFYFTFLFCVLRRCETYYQCVFLAPPRAPLKLSLLHSIVFHMLLSMRLNILSLALSWALWCCLCCTHVNMWFSIVLSEHVKHYGVQERWLQYRSRRNERDALRYLLSFSFNGLSLQNYDENKRVHKSRVGARYTLLISKFFNHWDIYIYNSYIIYISVFIAFLVPTSTYSVSHCDTAVKKNLAGIRILLREFTGLVYTPVHITPVFRESCCKF